MHGDRRHLPRRLADFLKREAKRDIEALVAKHTTTVGRRAKAIRYRDTVSRWGSCTSDGVLSFSWRIMMAPPAVIDYLVAHEVAHLKEMNHGPKFWKLCGELCPTTERCKAWLKRNGKRAAGDRVRVGSGPRFDWNGVRNGERCGEVRWPG